MHIYSFEKLEAWKESMQLATTIYKYTKGFPKDERYGLISQMRRCSVSISSNLAEGTSRTSKKDKARFMTIAYSSTIELLNQLIISKQLGYLNEKDYQTSRQKIESITNKINALKKHFLK